MFLIKIEEIPPDYEQKSTDVLFSSKWEAECFVYDMNIKRLERENDRILFKLTVAILIFMGGFVTCIIYSASQDLHRISMNSSK